MNIVNTRAAALTILSEAIYRVSECELSDQELSDILEALEDRAGMQPGQLTNKDARRALEAVYINPNYNIWEEDLAEDVEAFAEYKRLTKPLRSK
jgi:predicted nucleic acid-binding protein